MASLPIDNLITEIRIKGLERLRSETDSSGTIYMGESLYSNNEILKMLERQWRKLYAFMVEKQTKSIITNLNIPENSLNINDDGTVSLEISDLWKIFNIYLFSGGINIPMELKEMQFEDMFSYYNQKYVNYDYVDAGFYFENKKIYLPFTNVKYLIKYAKEDVPITEADVPRFFGDFLITSTVCDMKIAGQEATPGSAIYRENQEMWSDVKKHILTHRNKGNPLKIKRNNNRYIVS